MTDKSQRKEVETLEATRVLELMKEEALNFLEANKDVVKDFPKEFTEGEINNAKQVVESCDYLLNMVKVGLMKNE